jgi:hypothetical protein
MRISRLLLLVVLAAAVAAVVVPTAGALTFVDEVCPVQTGGVIKICPQGETGKSYSLQMKGRDGTGCVPFVTFRNVGTLPPGLTIASSGLISGTPTQQGEWTFWIEMKDIPSWEGGIFWCSDNKSTERQFSITIIPGLQIVQRQSSLGGAALNQPYSLQLTATGGGTQSWSVIGGALPAGVALNSSTGLISGSPTATGDFTFKVQVKDTGTRSDVQTYSLSVVEPLRIAKPAVGAEVGLPFSLELKATGGKAPYKWSAQGLPSGFALDQSTGVITGAPAATSSSAVKITVTDALGLVNTVDVTFPVAAKLGILKKALPLASVGTAYKARFTTLGGLRPFRWTILAGTQPAGALPAGLRLNARTGQLSGTPRKAGTYRLRAQVTDRAGGRANRVFVLKVTGARGHR